MTETHAYDSGVYFDTAPGEAIGCCDEVPGAPVHDVACSRCGNRRTARHDCPPTKTPEADAPLSQEERNAIATMRRLAARWPKTLMLVSMDGTLSVIRTNDERFHDLNGDRTASVIEDFYGIPNDGGGW